jgi:CheY-like chemotaxis protein
VRSDAILLERILINIVSNALRYTGEGGIVVGCRRRGTTLRIDVCDSGVGIPIEQQKAIFTEFYRGGGLAHVAGEGLGLGLAIVERLCTLLKHPISLVSAPGKGSRFSVTVPMVLPVTDAPAQSLLSETRYDRLEGKLVVVIDDDDLVLDGTGGLLRSWGCRALTAASEQEAVKKLGGEVPDLIISDYQFKEGRTGLDVVASVRTACGASVPAFLISGNVSLSLLETAQAHDLRLLHKPVEPMVLRAMVSRALSKAGPS